MPAPLHRLRFALAAMLCVLSLALPAAANQTLANAASQPAVSPEGLPQTALLSTWQYETDWPLTEVPEPSGLCYYAPRDTLFIVDDGGPDRKASLAEIDLDAKVLQQQPLGVDLEGVCYCPLDGMLYVCDEKGERVYIVNPTDLKQTGEFTISRDFQGEPLLKAGGNGIEGIEFIPDASAPDGGYLLLLNQDDPRCLVRIDMADIADSGPDNPVPLKAVWLLPEINSGELYYNVPVEELWVVHSWMNLMEVLDIHTMQTVRWEVVPGCAQEAVALDGQGRLWIGSDSGGLARYIREQSR